MGYLASFAFSMGTPEHLVGVKPMNKIIVRVIARSPHKFFFLVADDSKDRALL